MARAVDYAGVYPPARLPLADAVAEYARWHGSDDGWLLGRFVCPATWLSELAATWGDRSDTPLVVAAIGGGGDTLAALLERTAHDVSAIAAAQAAAGRRIIVDQLEVKLPPDLLAARDPREVAVAIGRLRALLEPALPPFALLAVEAPVAGAPPEEAAAAAAGVAAHNRAEAVPGRTPACLKARCGGLAAAAVSTPAELAAAVAACRDRGVALKATQGLHHPFRRRDAALGADTHGFVNLMAAAALAVAKGLAAADLEAVLRDGDPAHFAFADDGLAWGRHRLTLAELAAGRRHGVLSFGSCSLAEPRDDLAALGLL
jgi:hypothetical protein